MYNFLEKLQQARHAVRFAPERKKTMRDYLVRMTAADVVLRAPRKEHRPFGSFFMRPMPVLAGIMGLVLVGSSTSLAAQGALPGEFLYPVKVGVTEKIVEAIQFSPDAQAEYATELAERRLDEAVKLAERGSVTDDIEEELAERFTEHTSRAQTALAAVRTKNAERADGIAAAFEEALRARELAFGDDDMEDETVVVATAPSASDAGVSPESVPRVPVLMAIPTELVSGTASSSIESATSSVVAPSEGPSFRMQKNSDQSGTGERGKRVVRMKGRDSLREIRALRNDREVKIPVLLPRSSDGGGRNESGEKSDDVQVKDGNEIEVEHAQEIQDNRGGPSGNDDGGKQEDEQEKD